jgi:proteic killer suppression protein
VAIYNFRNKATEDINYGRVTKNSLKLLPKILHQKAQIKLARISAATSIEDLRELRGNRLETLQGNRQGQYSIRINDQYRICFRWLQENAYDVEIIDYHD